MRKSTIAISIAAVFAAPAFLMAGSARIASLPAPSSAPQQIPAHFNTPTDVVLYDQSGTETNGAPAQYDSSDPDYDADGADDFVVTDANGWTVTQFNFNIRVQTESGPQPLPAGAVFNVNVYPALGSGTGPDVAHPACTGTGLSGTASGTPAITGVSVPLTTPCVLPQGTYWVSFAANFVYPPQLFWMNAAAPAIGATAQWRNPAGGFGTTCSTFAPIATCVGDGQAIGGGNPNFLFQVVGSVNGSGGGGCGSGGICLKVGLSPADPANPNACGTATALDVTAGDQVNYCYKVTNNSGLALNYQSLSDNVNGALLTLVNQALPAGGNLQYNRVVTASASQTVTSTWTAQDQAPGYAFTTGNLNPGTPANCSDRLFADGFDGTALPCNGGTPGDFIDISGSGTALDPDDDGSVATTLPFSFNLYGQSSNQICVGNNGYILFGTTTCPSSGLYDNSALPSTDLPAAAILPFWTDFYTGGHVYSATIGTAPNRKFVVEWYQKNHYNSGNSDPGGVTFEVVFGEDGSLKFNYLKTTFESDPSWDNGGSATVGLQKNATLANQFSFNQASLHPQFYVASTATNPTVFTSTDNGVAVNVGAAQIQLSPASLSGSAAAGATTTTTLGIGNVGTRDLHWTAAEAPAAHLPPLGSRYAFPLGTSDGPDALLKTAAPRPHKPVSASHHANVPLLASVPAFAVMPEGNSYTPLDASAPATLTPAVVTGSSVGNVWGGGFVSGQFATEYVLGDDGLMKIDTATRAVTTINASTGGGDVWAATVDPTSGKMYYVGPSSAQKLFRVDDLGNGASVSVGSLTGSASGHIVSAIAIDANGRLWGIDKTQDTLIAIDKTTGATSLIGSLGFNSEGIASLAFDTVTGKLYLASLDSTRALSTMYTVDTTSGTATVVGPIGDGTQHLTALAVATTGTTSPCASLADVPWLSLAPSAGTTPPAGSVPVTATLNAGSLSAGAYQANVCVSSNDAAHPLVAVPVSFTVTPAAGNAPTLSKVFAPTSVAAGSASTLTITLANTNATAATLSSALTDTFPAGLVVAATPNAATTCGGTVTATAGSGSVSLGGSAAIPANGSCTVSVNVQAANAGSYANTIAAGALATSAGSNAAAANATLTVTPASTLSCPTENFDGVTAPALPAGWVFSSGAGAGTFTTVSTVSDSAPNSAFAPNLTAVNDIRLESPAFVPTAGTVLTFRNRYNLENGFDGAVLEISINGGAYQDIVTAGGSFIVGGYNGTLSTNATFQNPLVGRPAWTGSSGTGFITTTVTFPAASIGQSTKLRFRTGDDNSTAATGTPGWWVDTLTCGAAPPTIAKSFAPVNGPVGASSTLTISLAHPAGPATLTADLVDTLPAGLTVAATPNASTTCGGGTAAATAGGSSVTLNTGAVIPAAGCQVKVDVTATAPGIYANTIAVGALQTDVGNNVAAAAANYQATQAGFVTYSTGFEAPGYTIGALNNQQGWYASVPADWTVSAAHPGNGAQHARGTWTSAGSGTSFMLSPTQLAGTTTYSSASAKLAITVSGTGAIWDFAPQDPSAGSVVARVRFLNTGNKIQVLDPNGGTPAYVDTGATWTPGAYFDLKVVAKRADKTYQVCLNGTSIWSGTGFAANIANVAAIGTKGTGTQNNILDVDDVVIDNANSDGCSGGPAPVAPTLSKAFAPASVTAGSTSTLTITLNNANATAATLSSALTDTFPAGLVVAATPNAATTCGGTVTATAGSGSVSLGGSAAIPANGSCTVNVDVQAANAGSYANTIAAGALVTSAGSNAAAANATLAVNPGLAAPTLSKAFAPASVVTGSASTLTITLSNGNATAATLSSALTDTFPAGLVVAATPNAATTCGGTVTATAGSGSVSLGGSAAIPANGSCTVSVNVQAANAGSYANTIAAGALVTSAGSNAAAANATLTVTAPPVDPFFLYSNLGTDANADYVNGATTTVGTTRYTPMVCNRLTLAQPGQQLITSFSVVLTNHNAASVTPTTAISFYDDSGTGGGPGIKLGNTNTLYYGGGNYGVAIPAGKYQLNAAPFGYTATWVPAPAGGGNAKVWACLAYNSTTVTDALLSNLGIEKFVNAPTAGTTADLAFVSTGGANWTDNPTGTLVSTSGGTENVFGWELKTLGRNILLDSYQVVASNGGVGTSSYALNPSTGVAKNFSGYAATIATPTGTDNWGVTGLVLYASCTAGNYNDVQATIQFWDTFNGSAATDVFGNSTPIASTTVDLGAYPSCPGSSLLQFPVRLPTPVVVNRSGKLGITVKYSADSGAGLVADGSFMEALLNAPSAAPSIAVGSNASTGGTGWYKSASNRADLNFTGSTDYVTATRQHLVLRVYGDSLPAAVQSTSASMPASIPTAADASESYVSGVPVARH